MPEGYGIARTPPEDAGARWAAAAQALAAARNYWIASTRADGRPHAMPVWGVWLDGALMFSTSRDSQKGRNLARQPYVVAHLESGDDVLILEGALAEATDPALLARYTDAYEAKYSFRPDPSAPGDVVYLLRPERAMAWEERDFVNSAIRWRFRPGRA
jgi:hypothetical protein